MIDVQSAGHHRLGPPRHPSHRLGALSLITNAALLMIALDHSLISLCSLLDIFFFGFFLLPWPACCQALLRISIADRCLAGQSHASSPAVINASCPSEKENRTGTGHAAFSKPPRSLLASETFPSLGVVARSRQSLPQPPGLDPT